MIRCLIVDDESLARRKVRDFLKSHSDCEVIGECLGGKEAAEAILRLLRDPAFAASLGKNGREYVAAEFSFQKMIENTDQLYTELLHSRGAE